jgi:hypothetical protein
MAKNNELFHRLRSAGLRKSLAKPLAKLDGNSKRAGVKGEKLARRAVDDLTTAVDDIEKRVLRKDRKRSEAARKAARTRKRNAEKRRASSKKGAKTRSDVARARNRGTKRARR